MYFKKLWDMREDHDLKQAKSPKYWKSSNLSIPVTNADFGRFRLIF